MLVDAVLVLVLVLVLASLSFAAFDDSAVGCELAADFISELLLTLVLEGDKQNPHSAVFSSASLLKVSINAV